MKNNRGFTLVEIIVSIALLGVISVGMLSGLTTQFRFLTDTKVFTEDLSSAQQGMENQISDVKKTLENNGTPAGGQDYTLFSGTNARTVVGYPRYQEISVDNLTRLLTSVVGTETLEYPVATITDVGLKFQTINTTAYTHNTGSALYAASTITLVDPDNVNMTNIYRWYVSRAGFNIPMIAATPEETEVGTTYPRFPEDYTIIPNKSNDTLYTVETDYPGRHILCTVTPAATSGKMGATAVSNPLFVSGLTVRNNLVLHLDASMISKEESSQVSTSGDDFYVKQWRDISGAGNNASQSSDVRRPQLLEYFIGYIVDNGTWYDSYVKYAAFDGSNDLMSASVAATVDATGTSSTVFVVARLEGAADFTIYKNTVPTDFVSFASGWGTTTLTIGNTSTAVDVAEVIVYNAVLSDDGDTSDSAKVMKYLTEKYLPDTPTVAIRWLNDVTVTVVKGASYTPPSTVSAYMTSGRYQDVGVIWNPSAIDTSTTGAKYSTGTAVADSTKTCTLTVNVVEPAALTGIGDITVSDNGTFAKLTAGSLTPSGATATYQWQTSTDGGHTWSNVFGATSAVYSSGVWGQQYQVIATGSGAYTGSVTSNPVYLTVTPLTAIATPYVTGGSTYAVITAGALTPAGATATYQWQYYSSGWKNVSGATSDVYSYASWGTAYRVVATGYGAYSGTLQSGSVTPTQVPLTGIGDIVMYWNNGTPTLTAGAVAPSGATVTYQWQYYYHSSWYNISGATYSSYTGTLGTQYRVAVTGTGMYTGTVYSNSVTAQKSPLTSIGDISVRWNGDTPVLTAGALSPSGATATYQWQYYYHNSWYNISDATSAEYSGTMGTQYRVVATGSDGYTGTVYSNSVTPSKISITGIGAITVSSWSADGAPTMVAGAVTPSGATVYYQWLNNSGTAISGATSATYTGVAGQTYYVQVTGYGDYTGTKTSASFKPTQTSVTGVGDITVTSWSTDGVPTMAAGAVSPSGATVYYQWLVKDSGWQEISGATSASYAGVAGETYRVTVTGYGAYTGSKTSGSFTPSRTSVTGASISVSWNGSTPTLTASVTPSGATVTYQWLNSSGSAISGATSSTYNGTAGSTYYVRVTGTGAYTGTATSAAFTPNRTSLTGIGNITVSWNGSTPTLYAGAVSPSGATVNYQWLNSSGSAISGATSSSYVGTAGQTYYVRATGYGAYTGTVTSSSATAYITVTSVTISGSGSTLYASVSPTGATVTYEWQRKSWFSDWSTVGTGSSYSGYSMSWYYDFRVIVTGYGVYTGTITSSTYD